MDQRRYDAFRYVSLRINTLLCLLLVTPVMLWSSLVGTSALLVVVVWASTVGVRPADRWAAARSRGLSARAATTSVGWGRAIAVLVLAFSVTVLAAAGLRALVPWDAWLAEHGPATTAAAALTMVVLGAAPGTAAVLEARSRGTHRAGPAEDERPERRRDPEARPSIPRGVATVMATFLGSVNVAVLVSVLPLRDWVAAGAGLRAAAVAVLVLAFVTPWLAVWSANRRSGSRPSTDRQA